MGGSAGLTRVIAGVLPLAAILSLKGWNILDGILSKNVILKIAASCTLIYFIIQYTIGFYRLPIPLDPPQQLVKQASDWLKESQFMDKKCITTIRIL
jgi:hypothetical protein